MSDKKLEKPKTCVECAWAADIRKDLLCRRLVWSPLYNIGTVHATTPACPAAEPKEEK